MFAIWCAVCIRECISRDNRRVCFAADEGQRAYNFALTLFTSDLGVKVRKVSTDPRSRSTVMLGEGYPGELGYGFAESPAKTPLMSIIGEVSC